MDMTQLSQVLLWLTGMGAPIAAMALLSLLAENWPKWSTFSSNIKFYTTIILTVVIALLSAFGLKYTVMIATIQPWFQVAVSAVLAYYASQKTYQGSLNSRYGKRFSRSNSKTVKQLPLG
jgi:hypothetical protein